MDYQPLNAERDEIRLVYYKDKKDLSSSGGGTAHDQNIVQLEMRMVSLQDYTESSLEEMQSSGNGKYTVTEYIVKAMGMSKTIYGLPLADRESYMKKLTSDDQGVGRLPGLPDYGRWSWGDFAALSYTWGDASKTRTIQVNSRSVEVTENLEEFLQSQAAEPRTGFWIDALCINQSDIEERSFQVKRMRDIYSLASGVIVWLGKESHDSAVAIEVLTTIGERFSHALWKLSQMGTETENVAEVYAASKALLLEILAEKFIPVRAWVAIHRLLSRPYWSRLWIIQELALGISAVNICCGSQDINWPALSNAIALLHGDIGRVFREISRASKELSTVVDHDFSMFNVAVGRVRNLSLFNEAAWHSRKITNTIEFPNSTAHSHLENMLLLSRGAGSTDDKDKIYGILSLVDNALADMITPDYTLSISEVYIAFAKSVINWSASLDIITNHGLRKPGRTLPSWVPDWTEEATIRFVMTPKKRFHASKDSKPIVNFLNGKLLARGFAIDSVDGLGAKYSLTSIKENDFEGHQPTQSRNPYENDVGLRQAIWRTLVLNRDRLGEIASERLSTILQVQVSVDNVALTNDPDIFSEVMLMIIMNRSLRIGGKPFADYFSMTSQVATDIHDEAIARVWGVILGRRPIVTKKGYFGMVRNETQRGDMICVLLGSSTPVILRPCPDGLYTVVGEAYIHGFMGGEAMQILEEYSRKESHHGNPSSHRLHKPGVHY